jgi:hypothetical protein
MPNGMLYSTKPLLNWLPNHSFSILNCISLRSNALVRWSGSGPHLYSDTEILRSSKGVLPSPPSLCFLCLVRLELTKFIASLLQSQSS